MNRFKESSIICILFTFIGILSQVAGQTDDFAFASQLESKAAQLDRAGDYEGSKRLWIQAANIHKNLEQWDDFFYCRAYYANSLSKLSQIEKVEGEIQLIRKELDSLKIAYPHVQFDTIDVIVRRFNTLIFLEQNDLKSAEAICKSLIAEFESIPDKSYYDKQILISQYFKIAEILIRKGAYEHALEYNGKALAEIETGGFFDLYLNDGSILNAVLQNADSHLALGDTSSLLFDFDQMKSYLRQLSTKVDERSFDVYQRIFDYYLRIGEQDSSRLYVSHLLDFLSFRNEAIYHQARFHSRFSPGNVAIPILKNNAEMIGLTSGLHHARYALLKFDLARLFYRNNQFDNCDRELDEIRTLWSIPTGAAQPGVSFFWEQNARFYIDFLILESNLYWARYQLQGDHEQLQLAWSKSKESLTAIEEVRNSFVTDADQIFLIASSYHIYEQALEICYALHQEANSPSSVWIDTAFMLMEKSKSVDLIETEIHRKAMEIADLPDSILDLEVKLRLQILQHQEIVFDLHHQGKINSKEYTSRQSLLVDLKNQYQEIIDEAKKSHPVFARLRKQKVMPGLNQIKEVIREDSTGMIEFFYGDQSVFMIVSNGMEDRFYKLGGASTISALCNRLTSDIRDFGSTPTAELIEAYATSGFELYHQTLGKIDVEMPNKIQIIPDGALRGIPFSALLVTAPSQKDRVYDFQFLLLEKELSYIYSYAFQSELNGADPEIPDLYVHAFSPEFHPDLSAKFPDEIATEPLIYNEDEVKKIKRLVHCKHFNRGKATKDALIDIVNSKSDPASVLHIASHAVADQRFGQLSFIRFANDRPDKPEAILTARELYRYRLPYHLVFLSACETAQGEIKRGEGIVGLARSFFYAGVKSMVTTLWSVSDETSVQIVSGFYENLRKGYLKDGSLRSSQLAFLKKQQISRNKILAHPFYWAAYIPIGGTEAFREQSTFQPTIYQMGIGMLIILMVLGLIWFARKNKSAKSY